MWKGAHKLHQMRRTTTAIELLIWHSGEGCYQLIPLQFYMKISICQWPPSSLELIRSQYFFPTSFPNKNVRFIWNPWIPNNVAWKGNWPPQFQERVEGFNRKYSILRPLLDHPVTIIPSHQLNLQYWEKCLNDTNYESFRHLEKHWIQ